MLYVFGRFIFFLIFKVCCGLRVYGRKNIPRHGGFLLAGNHMSYLDPIVFGCACPRSLSFMARDTLFKRKFFGGVLLSVHAFPLKRNAADFGAMKEAFRRLGRAEGLLLFPEGTRTMGGQLGRGRAGVGFLARKSGVPVIPAYCLGTEKVLSKTSRRFEPGQIIVWFGEPLMRHPGQEESDEDFSARVMENIQGLRSAAHAV
jgi:1-acyl-sn-glycerol-3-phosphate acyltransferase